MDEFVMDSSISQDNSLDSSMTETKPMKLNKLNAIPMEENARVGFESEESSLDKSKLFEQKQQLQTNFTDKNLGLLPHNINKAEDQDKNVTFHKKNQTINDVKNSSSSQNTLESNDTNLSTVSSCETSQSNQKSCSMLITATPEITQNFSEISSNPRKIFKAIADPTNSCIDEDDQTNPEFESYSVSKDLKQSTEELETMSNGIETEPNTRDSITEEDSRNASFLEGSFEANLSSKLDKEKLRHLPQKVSSVTKDSIIKKPFLDSKLPVDEDSVSSLTSQRSSSKRKWNEEDSSSTVLTYIPAENIIEYQWPTDHEGDYYMLQEQISEFLGAKSFKRRYPELFRRSIDIKEREFLKETFTLPETLYDLGLTAVKSEEIIDLMVKNHPEKYQEYERVLQERNSQVHMAASKNYSAQPVVTDKEKMEELIKRTVQAAADYNSRFNQERRDERKACVDLQTQTVHFPIGRNKKKKISSGISTKFPVALIPGQFQEHYRKYTPNELRYLPISTVVYGPPPAPSSLQILEAQSDDSMSDSDESSSSGESSSSQESQESQDDSAKSNIIPKTPQPKAEEVEVKVQPVSEFQCHVCKKFEETDTLVQCSDCKIRGHSSCLDLTDTMVKVIKTYPWQCMECKKCDHCRDPNDEDKMMFCDKCDRGYHTFCVGVRNIPSGRWICKRCGQCAMCGAKMPGPEGSSRAQWQNEYAKNKNGEMEIVKTLCISCVKPSRRSKSIGTPIVAN